MDYVSGMIEIQKEKYFVICIWISDNLSNPFIKISFYWNCNLDSDFIVACMPLKVVKISKDNTQITKKHMKRCPILGIVLY